MSKRLIINTAFLVTFFFVVMAESLYGQAGAQFQERLTRVLEPGQLGDTLSVWGDVREPGRYLVPRGAEVAQVVQFAGGPSGSRIGGNQNAWTRTRISISISQYDRATGQMGYHQFHMRYNDEIPPQMRNFELSSNDIVSVEVRQVPSFLDVLGVVGPILGTITTTVLLYDRIR